MMNLNLALGVINKIMPDYKENAAGVIEEQVFKLIVEAENGLIVDNGEDYASIMVIKSKSGGEIYLLTCAMSIDDKILRTISRIKAVDFINKQMEDLL